MTATAIVGPRTRVPFKRGFLTEPLDDLASVRFAGSRCRACGVALLGVRRRCENCASRDVDPVEFESSGVIYSVTVQRYPPPLPFAAPTPWVPRAVAWIDLDRHGPRIMAPVAGAADEPRIGSRVRFAFAVGWSDDAGRDVISYVCHLDPDGAA
jgi:uncharacterized OB-fold protein